MRHVLVVEIEVIIAVEVGVYCSSNSSGGGFSSTSNCSNYGRFRYYDGSGSVDGSGGSYSSVSNSIERR